MSEQTYQLKMFINLGQAVIISNAESKNHEIKINLYYPNLEANLTAIE